MSKPIVVPTVGESITEVTLLEWQVEPGAWVAEDDTLCTLETDKVNVDVPAPCDGILTATEVQAGDIANVGDVLGHFEAAERPADAPKPTPSRDAPKAPEPETEGTPAKVMPAAARAAHDAGIDPRSVSPSGPGGRTLKEDVERSTAASPASASAPVQSAPAGSAPAPSGGDRAEEAVPMSRLRRVIAKRLVEVQQNAAILTTFNEIDMLAVMDLRKTHQETFVAKHGRKLGFMSFFVRATIEALKAFPNVGAEIRDDHIIYKNYADIGVAIGGGKGLVVPVIRNAERLSFAGIEAAITDFAVRAKAGKIQLDELQGGNFSITNGGIYGSMMSTPILNPPQSGILGMHAIKKRPICVGDTIVARPMMYVALSYDHRIVDGREAVGFLKHIKDNLEEPARMLLDL
jgi:2-oxoglutarate dehydrogenase E2 component (dihydrolipoamide succinyltransferase)